MRRRLLLVALASYSLAALAVIVAEGGPVRWYCNPVYVQICPPAPCEEQRPSGGGDYTIWCQQRNMYVEYDHVNVIGWSAYECDNTSLDLDCPTTPSACNTYLFDAPDGMPPPDPCEGDSYLTCLIFNSYPRCGP